MDVRLDCFDLRLHGIDIGVSNCGKVRGLRDLPTEKKRETMRVDQKTSD